MIQRSPITKKYVKCSVCKMLTSLYRTERDEYKNKIYVCSKHPRKEKVAAVKSIVDEDRKFYDYVWKIRPHFCEECGKELKQPSIDYFHHILSKAKFKYFRHEPKNISILCGMYGCHAKAESAVSYPKMKIYAQLESIKKELLESVGMNYGND